MLDARDYQQENISLSEQKQAEQKNRFLDEYNGRPTLEKIQRIILQKRASGDLDKRISVSIEWTLEMLDNFMSQSGMTYQMARDAPSKLYAMEQRMLLAEQKRDLEHRKCQDLLLENTIVYERLSQISEECKQKEAITNQKLNETRIVKLPISKVRMFLAFCKPEDDLEDFYVQIDDKGNMQRIVRKPEEL